MSNEIRIKKGLDIKLKGQAQKEIHYIPLSKTYALVADDFHHIIPKLEVKLGDEVKSGDILFRSKANARIAFPAPMSGEVVEISRGNKRKILEIKILADRSIDFRDHGVKNPAELSTDQIKTYLLESGCWAFIRQRPYDIIAFPDKTPKAIFISACATAPLAPDFEYIFRSKEKEMCTGIEALKKLTPGKMHLSITGGAINSPFHSMQGVEFHNVYGPHPAGNISVQIAHVDPIDKFDIVWFISPQDLVIIGELFLTGKWNPERTLAITGSQIKNPHYVKTRIGAQISDLVKDNIKEGNNRYISGNVLTGKKTTLEGHLRYYSDQITVIPEGDDYDLFGWLLPRPKKFSVSRANMFSWLTPKKKYALNTNLNGEERAFVLTGWYEKYFPFDIYPMHLLKAILTEDLEKMEQLGIYEVAPEDFALTEYVDVSKLEHQQIVRRGLDLMIREIG
ncbi:MAG: Na(+)-translocating NADH-quinone reductase subunit A [Flavobacteriales bacterium AspAUS03]